MPTCNPSSPEVEAGSLDIQGHPSSKVHSHPWLHETPGEKEVGAERKKQQGGRKGLVWLQKITNLFSMKTTLKRLKVK